jgi:hypothetical protein
MRAVKLVFALLMCISPIAFGQIQAVTVTVKPLTDADIQMLREDVQADKNDIITHTMMFTEAESKTFWPVYKQYAAAQKTIGDQRLALIKDYAQNYGTMTDAKATEMVQTLFKIEDQTQALRKQYFPQFVKALGAKRAAKFYQVDNRLTLMVNLQLASLVPLIP